MAKPPASASGSGRLCALKAAVGSNEPANVESAAVAMATAVAVLA